MPHSPLGPSSLFRRAACPGSYSLEKDMAETTNPAARRGTLGHWGMEQVLTNKDLWPTVSDKLIEGDGDEDLLKEVEFCYEFTEQFRPGEWEYHIEETLDLTSIHEQVGFGTTDLVLVKPLDMVCVFDWKFGRSMVSRAADNIQCSAYAVGAARRYGVGKVVVYVVQAPFRYITTYEYDDQELENAATAIRYIVAACLNPDAPRLADANACKYCKGKADCPEARALNAQLAVVPKDKIDNLPAASLANLLKQCDVAEEIIGAVKQRAYAMLEAGADVPGFKLKAGRQMRKWAEGADKALAEAAAKLQQPADSIWAERELLSPAQLEKAWGKEGAKVIEPLVNKVQAKSSIVEVK